MNAAASAAPAERMHSAPIRECLGEAVCRSEKRIKCEIILPESSLNVYIWIMVQRVYVFGIRKTEMLDTVLACAAAPTLVKNNID